MIWTRKSLTETSDWFNQKPLVSLDETLRFPLALEEFLGLAKEEYGVVLKKKPLVIHNGYFYFRPYWDYFLQLSVQPKVYFVLWRLIRETKKAKNVFKNNVKKFLKEVGQLKQKDLSKLSNEELFEDIKKTIKWDAHWLFKLGASLATFYHYLSEILLKILYRLLVKDKYPQNYYELLIGYPSKLKEADLAFWQVVQGKLSLEDYLEKYCFRATDASLVIPTIGENKEEFQKQVNSFKNVRIPDFEKRHKEILEKRKLREKYVESNFRSWIPFGKVIFDKILAIARDYISVRETRRFYYTKGTFLIRRSLLELGKRLEFLENPDDLFFLTKDELEGTILRPKAINRQQIQAEIGKRRKQCEKWNKQTPPEEIKL